MEIELFNPKNEPQARAFESTAIALLMDGPRGSGKTHVAAAKATFLGYHYPNNCIALVRKKRVDLKPTLWKWFVEKCLALFPSDTVVASNDTELYRRLYNGSEFYGIGLDSTGDVNKLASREYGLIIVEEATELTEEDFDKKLVPPLRLPDVPFHQIMLICNPHAPSHFLYRKFIDQLVAGYERIQGEILDDLPTAYYTMLQNLGGVWRKRYYEGIWATTEGEVYPYDPKKHIIKSFVIPEDWRKVVGVDFGFDHPFVAQFWAVSPDDIWYMVKEIYMTNRIVSKHAEDIHAICDKYDFPKVAICDHDKEDSATLRSCKIITKPASKSRLPGQQSVYARFDNDRVFFFEDSLWEIDQGLMMETRPYKTTMEFHSYIWANTAKEDMVKVKDDGMDTMRYVMHTAGALKPFSVLVDEIEVKEATHYGQGAGAREYAASKAAIKKLQRGRRERHQAVSSKRR